MFKLYDRVRAEYVLDTFYVCHDLSTIIILDGVDRLRFNLNEENGTYGERYILSKKEDGIKIQTNKNKR
jgi:hypothetical protein